MSSACNSYRDALLGAGLLGEPPGGHAAGCAACAEWARRAQLVVRALDELPRVPAPSALDGSVVAALEAGFRQARAARAVAELGRVSSPRELDHAVDAELEPGDEAAPPGERLPASLPGARVRAPAVLDRLVREELADPRKASARRYLGSLRRRRVPEELALRLALDLEHGLPARRVVRGPHLLTALGLAAAAMLIAWGILATRPDGSARPRGREIVIERVADASQLSPFARTLLDGASGGLVFEAGS